jgi:phage terminase small subunit
LERIIEKVRKELERQQLENENDNGNKEKFCSNFNLLMEVSKEINKKLEIILLR